MNGKDVVINVNRSSSRKDRRGFTLVELIVVLSIIAILAAAGIVAGVKYIKRSRYDKNCQHAVTVYQTAQTAISQKISNGTLDSWVKDYLAGDSLDTSELVNVNDSVHGTFYLTFNPGKTDSPLYGLLSPYFHDKTIFGGTISVVFDVSATRNAIGSIVYSANVVGAFYSDQNSSDEGWDPDYISSSEGKGDVFPWNELPCTDPTFRENSSLVGYYEGAAKSLLDRLKANPVFIPLNLFYEMDGHVIGPTEDGAEVEGYLFNLRNGETLDVSWAIFDGDGIAHDVHGENMIILLRDAEADADDHSKDVELTVDASAYNDVVWSGPHFTYESVSNTHDITRESYDGIISLSVKRGTTTPVTMKFPITKTHVTGDGRTGCPDPETGYYEYSISLDCMMARQNDSITAAYGLTRYCSQRLFSDNSQLDGETYSSVPRNIYALLKGESTWNYYDSEGNLNSRTVTHATYAARAVDDPVYFTKVAFTGGHTHYFYTVKEHAARYDGEDGYSLLNAEYLITGRCVVNTLFGDAVYDKASASDGSISYKGGTLWSSSEKEAVITSFRHLYNIRNIGKGNNVTYKIVRDLNWYFPATNSTAPVSEVKVFTSGAGYRSPVEDGEVKIVSFPSIRKLLSNQVLTSVKKSNGSVCSINNIQMRVASFMSGDPGYGLICQNNGTIYNIYTNNLNLILSDVADGSDSDYAGGEWNASICPEGVVTMAASADVRPCYSGTTTRIVSKPVGGLVGYNTSRLGSADAGLKEENNTIRMDNCIVMAGPYWNIDSMMKVGTGGIVGLNEGTSGNNVSTYGVLQVRGSFAVIGADNVGGIMGETKAQIDARLVVDGTSTGTSVFTLPKVSSNNDQKLSCVIASTYKAGGAIGSFWNGKKFNYSVKSFSASDPDPVTGKISFAKLSDKDYQISVTLPANGMIANISGGTEKIQRSVGGAIASLNNCTGDNLNIRVVNNGNIVTDGTNNSIFCGGAIGFEKNCVVTKTYLNINNGTGSRIGSFNETYNTADNNTVGARAAGGAYGALTSSNAAAPDRTIAINMVNDGSIVAKGTNNADGAGGVIGSIGSRDSNKGSDAFVYEDYKTPLLVNVVNNTNSRIIGIGPNINNSTGTGGAVGGMNRTDGVFISAESVLSVENHGLIEGPYHVGGVIGDASINRGKLYAVNYGTVNGKLSFAGGVVGRAASAHYGTIQSVLRQGALVTGGSFVGGAAGRLTNFQDNAVIRTIVMGSATVTGTDSIIGGICGDLKIHGTGIGGTIELKGDTSAPKLTVRGTGGTGTAVGGAIGLFRAHNVVNSARVEMPDQSATNKLVMTISGINDVGGAVGRLNSSNTDENAVSTVLNSWADYSILTDIDVVLHPDTTITGTGNNVGGAVGHLGFNSENGVLFSGKITVTSASGSSSTGSVISGKLNVGGAIGRCYRALPGLTNGHEGGITVDFTRAAWTITSTVAANNEANVGGAVGIFEGKVEGTSGAVDNTYPIKANLGLSTVTTVGKNAGGAIGKNQIRNGLITVTLSGMVTGHHNIGGAIGDNTGNINTITVNVASEGVVTANANVTEANVGGAVGSNLSSIAKITCTIDGKILNTTNDSNSKAYGNNVGGAIGYCNSSNKAFVVRTIDVTLQGEARVRGKDNVGGALGLNLCNVDNVNVSITGASRVIGDQRVGGAVGFASAKQNVGGDKIANRTDGYGCIASVISTISADLALEGNTRVGGAIGQVGDKWGTGDKYKSAAVLKAEVVINASSLFETSTGCDPNEDACVGGVIGQFVDGRVWEVVLSGTGGVAHINGAADSTNVNIQGYPSMTFERTVLMAAGGRSVGGIIGQIGVPGYQQNVCLSKISVAENGPRLCVVSTNGSDCIGGWIGSGYAAHGGIGNNNLNEYNGNKKVTYNVNNVRLVYSTGSEVGGFCGRSDSQNANSTSNKGVFANIIINLDNANINGRSQVGGVFGSFTSGWYSSGSINVTLTNHTNIGDITGNGNPGDNTTYPSICYDAGGAIGYVNSTTASNGKSQINVPVIVQCDSTSRIWAGGTEPVSSLTLANGGVGGAFGRCYATFNNNAKIIVAPYYNTDNPNDPYNTTSPVTIYSASSNVGGAIGVMVNGSINESNPNTNTDNRYANANITSEGNARAGGFVGRLDNGTIKFSHFNGSVNASNSNSSAGGFVGGMTAGTIESCYTTATIKSGGSYTGGFVGNMAAGTVKNSYVGGHTYQGQYISGQGNANINGSVNVGGFIGTAAGAVTLDNCYSTASVSGNGSNIGGFIGNEAAGSTIKNCYCTGRVEAPYDTVDVEGVQTRVYSDHTGSFAGFINSANLDKYTGNKVMQPVNDSFMPLVGSASAVYPTLNSNTGKITGAENTSIRNGGSYTAVPFDNSLRSDPNAATTAYQLRAVINSTHYGDWPLPVNGTSIEGAEIFLRSEDDPSVLLPFENDSFSFEYSRSSVTFDERIVVMINGLELERGDDYTVSYVRNDRAGTATVIMAAKSGGAYAGAVSKTFTITPVDITSESKELVITLNDDTYTYTGAAIIPDLTVSLDGVTLVRNTDYYLTYSPNNCDIGVVTATVHGMGNYVGVKECQDQRFTITGVDLSDTSIVTVELVRNDDPYYGEDDEGNPIPHEPGVVVRYLGNTIREGRDYTVSYENNTQAGDASVIVTGTGNIYVGSRTLTFNIMPAVNSWVKDPTIEGWTYGDEPNEPTGGKVKFGTIEYAYYTDSNCENEISAEDLDTAGAGTYYVKAYIDENENYSNVVPDIKSFTIEPYDISTAFASAEVEISIEDNTYTGSAVYPDSVAVTITLAGEERMLSEGTDYVLTYSDADGSGTPKASGTVTVTVSGTGNYIGSVSGTYEIVIRHHVIYELNGGVLDDSAADLKEQTIDDGAKVTRISPQYITYDGHSFHGWYSDEALTKEYSFDSAVNSDLTLYAKWVEQYTITFDPAGGTEVASITEDVGTEVIKPEDPQRTGYTFQGWFVGEGIIIWPVTLTDDMQFTAHWSINKYDVKFVIEDDDQVIPDQTIDYNDYASEPEVTLKEGGYRLDGWYLDEEYTEAFDFGDPVTDDITLHARWIKQYTITFDPNGGTDVDSITDDEGTEVPKPEDPQREGYTFDKWFIGNDNPISNDSWPLALISDYDLIAHWNKNKYDVKFVIIDDEQVIPDQIVEHGDTASVPDVTPKEGDFILDGWYTSDEFNANEVYNFGDQVTGSITLYARWVPSE